MPITDFLVRDAKLYPADVALVEVNPQTREEHGRSWREFDLVEPNPAKRYRREMTWREFNDSSNRFAHMLLNAGVVRESKVGVLLMNCLEWLPIYMGVLKTGAIAVPLNYRYTAEEIRSCVDLADVDTLIFGPEFTERVNEVLDQMPNLERIYFVGEECPDYAISYLDHVGHFSHEEPAIEITDDDLGAIYFSSGTTGFPKAILHKHKSLMRAAITEQAHHSQTHEDNFLCIPPLYHVGAKMHWMGGLTVGAKTVLLRGVSPEWILRTTSEEQCTIVWLLVPWAQDILDAIDAGEINMDELKLDQWRLMHIGAQPVPPSLVKRWLEHFPKHEYDTNYGLSEGIGPGSVHLGVENVDHVGAIGVAGFGWEAEVRAEDGSVVVPGSGQVGELCLRGDGGMMECYYKNPEATADTLRDGWLYTGDMAEVDKDGFIYLVDRKKDVIITGGENIYPVQIEDFIRANDCVKDVAVIGIPDDRLGEIALAVIELKPGSDCTKEQMEAYCEELPRYKRPRAYAFAEVPRNATGKIEKPKLRQIYGGAERVIRVENTQ